MVVIIIIVIVIVIVITQVVNKSGKKKRDLIYNLRGLPVAEGAKWVAERALEARAVERRALQWTG